MADNRPRQADPSLYRLRLLVYTTVGIFVAEVLIMVLIEGWLSHLPVLLRVFLDAALLVICVLPILYFLVFREMAEQVVRRLRSERTLEDINRTLELQVEERTARLQRANEELLGEVRERARVGMALGQALKEADASRSSLQAVIEAIDDGLLVVDAGGTVQLANQAAEALLGGGDCPLAGRELAGVLAPAFAAEELGDFLSAGNDSRTRVFSWPGAGQGRTERIEMRLGPACAWQDEPAAILLLRRVRQ